MKNIYDSYEDAIDKKVKDFIVVTDTEILPDGKVRVTGERYLDNDPQGELIDSLPFKSWLIDE